MVIFEPNQLIIPVKKFIHMNDGSSLKSQEDEPITEEDKIIIEHLFERFRYSLSFGDTLETKFAQMIALNGLILSVILVKRIDVGNFFVYALGLCCIICAILVGIYGYRTTEWCVGAKDVFFKDWKIKFSSKEGIEKLKDMLTNDIGENKIIQTRKSEIFDFMLYLNILGLVLVVLGYYVGQ
jgi:hypothetical protein